ncbi:MAG: hypothetical protein ACJA1A_001157 [Saprospiraceae bacterium]|jgi:hypothetical protein
MLFYDMKLSKETKVSKTYCTPNGLPNLFGRKKSCKAKQYRMTLSFYTKLTFQKPIVPLMAYQIYLVEKSLAKQSNIEDTILLYETNVSKTLHA